MAHNITCRHEFESYVRALAIIHECSVTSGGRTVKRNVRAGGVVNSRHLDWLAIDLVPDTNTTEVRKAIVEHATKLGMFALDEIDHIHIQAKREDLAP